ncbi:MAG: hypothetical protein D4R94_02975 [Chitinophagaceae bacterium]|nr:MAG: hypothetical protein D4R94_02975 [Chitinophagaceae bacterium]
MEMNIQTLENLSKEKLIEYINEYIKTDFSKILQLLYRIDVSEATIKKTLQAHPDLDAAILLADLIIERLAATKKAREQFSQGNISDEEERW